jgi:2-methylfumaryl-CoA hydratase
MSHIIDIDGPYFEDFQTGQVFEAPAVTLTAAHAVLHQALTGDRLRLPLDHHACSTVTGCTSALAHPMLVANIAIGQSTEPSQHVKGNLFYRGLLFLRPVHIGDTLRTTTRVVALRQSRAKPGRAATGLVVLEIVTRNQHDQDVLHFWRCPMLPCRDPDVSTERNDDLAGPGSAAMGPRIREVLPAHWQLDAIRTRWMGRKSTNVAPTTQMRVVARDTITSAPELVRATLNMANTHLDARFSHVGKRLVYGGHTISIAFAQTTRALPNLLTMLGWESCDHTAPVIEGDMLRSEITVLEVEPVAAAAILKLQVRTFATHERESASEELVLDWIFWAYGL